MELREVDVTAPEGAEQKAPNREEQPEGKTAEKNGGHDLSRRRMGRWRRYGREPPAANVHPLKGRRGWSGRLLSCARAAVAVPTHSGEGNDQKNSCGYDQPFHIPTSFFGVAGDDLHGGLKANDR